MERASTLIRWTIATLGSLLALAIFVPLGGSLWIVALIRAIIAFAFAVCAAAIKTSSYVNPATLMALKRAVEFFPKGIATIVANFMAMGRGNPTSVAAADLRIDYRELTINAILAAVFYAALALHHYGQHLHTFALNVRGGDALFWAAVALGVLIVVRLFGRGKTGIVLAASVAVTAYLVEYSPQVVHAAADWTQDTAKWMIKPYGFDLRLDRWRIGTTIAQTAALVAAVVVTIFVAAKIVVGTISDFIPWPDSDDANAAAAVKRSASTSNSNSNVVRASSMTQVR
jgi:hypothetical protein